MNINTFLIVLSSTMALLLFILIVKNIKLKKKITALAITYSNMQRLLDFKDSAKPNNDMHQENFIKFLSDSRDWAFEYIESVQKGLDKFVSEVDASISYFDEYGEVLSINRPDYDSMKRISVAFKELKKLLPEEEKTK